MNNVTVMFIACIKSEAVYLHAAHHWHWCTLRIAFAREVRGSKELRTRMHSNVELGKKNMPESFYLVRI